jgi:hypothetical protein
VGNASRDGLGAVKLGIRSHVEDLIACGLRPRRDASSEKVDFGRSAVALLHDSLGEAFRTVHEFDVAINAYMGRFGWPGS